MEEVFQQYACVYVRKLADIGNWGCTLFIFILAESFYMSAEAGFDGNFSGRLLGQGIFTLIRAFLGH